MKTAVEHPTLKRQLLDGGRGSKNRSPRQPDSTARYSEDAYSNGSPSASVATRFVQLLDERVSSLVSRVIESDLWSQITAPNANPAFIKAFMREIYLEIFFYNQHIVEATFAILGQMPRDLDVRALKAMLRHQAEEFDHGEMALRDYIALGGPEANVRTMRLSPGAFAAAGMWWMLVKMRDPFAYLGAEYLFESLTPILCQQIKPFLVKNGLTARESEFVEFHAEEDPRHAALIQELIAQVITKYPNAKESIMYGYDCFEFVYPMPVWQCAYERAIGGSGIRPVSQSLEA